MSRPRASGEENERMCCMIGMEFSNLTIVVFNRCYLSVPLPESRTCYQEHSLPIADLYLLAPLTRARLQCATLTTSDGRCSLHVVLTSVTSGTFSTQERFDVICLLADAFFSHLVTQCALNTSECASLPPSHVSLAVCWFVVCVSWFQIFDCENLSGCHSCPTHCGIFILAYA